MKTRKEIISEIVARHERHSATKQAATLERALYELQDAILFQMASDLGISLETEARL